MKPENSKHRSSVGTEKQPAVKVLPIFRPKVYSREGSVVLEGYANTKNHADRYGDVPAIYRQKREFLYDCSHFLKNPVLLIDHVNSIDHVAGSVVQLAEDETGLFFRARFSDSDHPVVAHARKIYTEGHARGISIAGRFHYENPENPNQLTLAEIYEISLVAVPADPNALAAAMEKALKTFSGGEADEQTRASVLHQLKSDIDRWLTDLRRARGEAQ